MSQNRSATLPQRTKIQALNSKAQDATTIPYMLNDVSYRKDMTNKQFVEANSNKFPIRPLPKDPYDTDWNMKQDLVQKIDGFGAPLITSARPLPVTDRDLDYLKRKRADEEYASYQSWLSSRFDLNDPAEVALFKKIAPSYFAQREALINEQIDLTAKYAKLKLFGPESEEDLTVEYMVETGRTQLPRGPIWDPFTWMMNQAGGGSELALARKNAALDPASAGQVAGMMKSLKDYNQATYQAGLFSPLKALNLQSPGPWGLQEFNRADITGDPSSRALGPYGARVPTTSNWNVDYMGAGLTGNRGVVGEDGSRNAYTKKVEDFDYALNANRYGPQYTSGGTSARDYTTNTAAYEKQRGNSFTSWRS